jgi:phosphoribosylamine-glycine ligase
MSKENTVVVIGSGGAESALVEAYGKSPHVDRIIAIPGNDMMQELVPDKEVDILDEIQQRDSASIVKALNPIKRHIALVDIRNESAIASGLTDQLRRNKIMSASPSRDAGRL